MKTSVNRYLHRVLRVPLFTGVAVALVCGLLWAAWSFAITETATIHIFPSAVTTDGWDNAEAALTQHLSAGAGYLDFSDETSAYVFYEAESPADTGEGNTSLYTPDETGPATSTNEQGVDTTIPETEPSSADINEPVSDETTTDTNETAEVVGEEPTDAVEVPTESDPAPSALEAVRSLAGLVGSAIAYAQETETSTPPQTIDDTEGGQQEPARPPRGENRTQLNDVTICAVRNVPCKVIEFSGFTIGGVLDATDLTAMQLRMSLGWRMTPGASEDDKILVRYLHAGTWHVAGELAVVAGEWGNRERDGHVLFELPEITDWESLETLSVQVEYIREGSESAEIYLDGVWIDAEYHGLAADDVTLENIRAELQALEESKAPETIATPEGDLISFAFDASESGSPIAIRTSNRVARGLTSARTYVSLTNLTPRVESIQLTLNHADAVTVSQVLQYAPALAQSVAQIEQSTIAYFCESGWSTTTNATEAMCAETGEVRTCDALNDEAVNCIVDDAAVAAPSEYVYTPGWLPLTIESGDAPVQSGVIGAITSWFTQPATLTPLPSTHEEVLHIPSPIRIEPGATIFIALDTNIIPGTNGAVYLTAQGDKGAHARAALWSESAWRSRIAASAAEPSTPEPRYLSFSGDTAAGEAIFATAQLDGRDIRIARVSGARNWALPTAPFRMRLSINEVASSTDVRIDIAAGGPSLFTRLPPSGEGLALYSAEGTRIPATLTAFNRRARTGEIAVARAYVALLAQGAYLYFGGPSDITPGTELPGVQRTIGFLGTLERYTPPAIVELPYALHSFDASNASAGVWFQDQPTDVGTSTLFVYYGNAHATDASSETRVFESELPRKRATFVGDAGDMVWAGYHPGAEVTIEMSSTEEVLRNGGSLTQVLTETESAWSATHAGTLAPGDGNSPAIVPTALTTGIQEAVASSTAVFDIPGIHASEAAQLSKAEWGRYFLVPPKVASLTVWCSAVTNISVFSATTTINTEVCAGSSTTITAKGGEFPIGVRLGATQPILVLAESVTGSTFMLWSQQALRGAFTLDPISVYGQPETLAVATLADAASEDQFAIQKEYFKRTLRDPQFHELQSTTRDFEAGDDIVFDFNYESQRSRIGQFVRGLFLKDQMEVTDVRFYRDGAPLPVPHEITYGEGFAWELSVVRDPRAFAPGKYQVEIDAREGSIVTTDTLEFYWGVIAVNPDKAVYAPGETALLSLAALDDAGSTICDAILSLSITDPLGSVQSVPVERSGSCGPNNVTDIPDYRAKYTTGGPGLYAIELLHLNTDGEIVHRIDDSFRVVDSPSFSVTRTGPTRIYPLAPYAMSLRIVANRDFDGTVQELLPEGFVLSEVSGAGVVGSMGSAMSIEWPLVIAAGDSVELQYTFDAPDRSPYVYVVGPATFTELNGNVAFAEPRTWKIASDALGSYVEKAVSWSPTTAGVWETKSLSSAPFSVPANAVVEVAVVNSSAGTEYEGGIRAASSSVNRFFDIHEAEPQGQTVVIMHTQVSSTSTLQHYAENTTNISYQLRGYWTSGSYVDLMQSVNASSSGSWATSSLSGYGPTAGSVVEFVMENYDANNEMSAGVRQIWLANDRRISIHEPEAGGVSFSTMHVVASTSNAQVQLYAQTAGAIDASVDHTLVGYWSAVPEGLSYTERFDNLGGPNATSTWQDRALDSFGVPGTSIAEVSYSNIADANLSMLIGVRKNGSTIDTTFNMHEAEAGGESIARTHVLVDSNASSTIEYFSDDLTNDAFRLLGYWSADDYPPNAVTLYNIPFDNEKFGTSAPMFEFSATDPDGASDIVYQIQWDDDANLDDTPLGDRSSDNETGCTPACFENLTNPGDTSPFTEGDRARFTIRSGLTANTTYYWRARATDVSGSNIPSEWSDVQSFTYVAGTSPSQWFQTTDEQFENNSLTSAETTGSDSVQITTSPVSGAMVAYAEGTTQTPRYRLWSGTAWGSEDPGGVSALDVGGVIRWVVTQAAPTRDEYIVGTLDFNEDVNFQVYNATSTSWANLNEITTAMATSARRGFDIAYESLSGDALVVSCDGDADPRYAVWNGSSWGATSSINLTSANNCAWIKLAADPTSDEIVLVSQDSTGSTYEALVWDGSSWTINTQSLGSMAEPGHEGIAVAYEESGGQAVVVVSNGGANNNFIWTAWDGSDWSPPATQGLGDDLDSAALAVDDGTDRLGLCYQDDDRDIGFLVWDGDGWNTNTEIDTGGNNNDIAATEPDGRAVSCDFETTTARDGYLLMSYSDTAAGRYRYYTGTTTPAEATISTIQDSWTVGSARTGDGIILTVFFDDVNGRYDASSWDGSSWSSAVTLENSPSVVRSPFGEPMMIAAKRYQESNGIVLSTIVDFDFVTNQLTWGEALWNTTEPSNTNVLMRVRYATSTECNTLVPDSALPGNAAGFDAAQSPLDLSGISTSTYNQLCLEATLSSTGAESPTLDDWTVSWTRQPYLSQVGYRFYINSASSTPTDAWPVGTTLNLSENESIPALYGPKPNDTLRLRMAVKNQNVALATTTRGFRLEYVEASTCSADNLGWVPVGAIGSTTAKWRGADISGLSDGTQIAATTLSTSTVRQSYEESNDSADNPAGIPINGIGEWEWVIQHNASSSQNYCFRMVNDDGTELNAYSQYPSLLTNDPPLAPTPDKLFDNELVATTTPSFEFVTTDPQGEDLVYDIEIDDDPLFGSVDVDRDSQTNTNDFSNIVRTADKNPFTSGETVRFTVPSALTNNTTYWWRVRARDSLGTNEWGDWSTARSFTIDTSATITTWYQTTQEQFETDDLVNTETSASDDVILSAGQTLGTTTGPAIDFDWKTTGNAWGSLSWSENETTGDIRYKVEYQTSGGTWALIPDTDLSGNSAGFGGSSVSLLGLNPTTYNVIRPVARFTDIGGSPRLLSWTVAWGLAVEQPTVYSPFDNEKVATRTPTFEFVSDDPQDQDLVYEISWATTTTFTSSTTRNSATDSGFTNTITATDTSPFITNQTVTFQIQPADILASSTTYWFRVRARDPSGGDAWSVWSALRSFTVDTTVNVSTWFQTTTEQFQTDTLTDTQANSDRAEITTTIREALIAYGEGTVLAPRYRIWNGATSSAELTAGNIADRVYWLELAAAPTRDEYAMITMGSTGEVRAQLYNGTTDTWGNQGTIVYTTSNILRRGVDIAYETTSGDAVAVACSGTDAMYRVWNGTSWGATSTIDLPLSNNCEWLRLASDPVSDELILVARDTTASTTYDYAAMVWSGSAWGNSLVLGSMAEANDEGMAVGYEESGNQALVVVSDNANLNFDWASWNGSVWSATSSFNLQDDFEGGVLIPDNGSDEMALCYVDEDTHAGFVEWSGSAWTGIANEVESTLANSKTERPITCQYETTSGRDNYLMVPYSDATQGAYQFWNGSILSGEVAVSSIQDSADVRSVRTGDGNILTFWYDDTNTNYDFTYWNGSSWSTAVSLETTSITGTTPRTGPLDMVARRYPSFTEGTVTGTAIDFDDGTGPKWQSLSFSDTRPGASVIRYSIEYQTATGSWAVIPDTDLPGNEAGTTTGPFSLGGLNFSTYNVIRPVAQLECVAGNCPTLNDWTVNWSEGITVSGSAKAYDQTTNLTSGTVAVAVNGVLQSGKTGTISAGSWSIANVTAFSGDSITLFIDGAATTSRAVAVTVYDGIGDVTGVELIERHVSLGSPSDSATTTNARIALYDNSVSGDNDVFFDVSAANDLTVCAISGCEDAELYIVASSTFTPSTSTAEVVTTHDIEINGTLLARTSTINVSGSWDNDGTFTADTSAVVFTATSTTETVDSTGATTSAFYAVTFGQSSGNATWNLSSDLDSDNTLTIAYGTVAQNGSNDIAIGGNLSIQANGNFARGTGTTTFDGSGSNTWTDSTTPKRNLGNVVIDGSTKTITLGSAVRAHTLTIGADDTLSVSGNHYAIEVTASFDNNNVFTAGQGTVTFTGTTTALTVEAGSSTFYNLSFSGTSGLWSFPQGSVTVTNNFTIATGTVTLPLGTTTIGGSLTTNGAFQHNNGTVLFNSTASGRTILASTSPFFNLTFSGSGGSWSFTDTSATTSNDFRLTAGTVTAPSQTLAIGGSFDVTGGTFSAGSGRLRFYASASETINPGGGSLASLLFDGIGGAWSFTVANATATGDVVFASGTTTVPSGIFAVGGSFIATSSFAHNSGTVRLYASDDGNVLYSASSSFNAVRVHAPSGGYTIVGAATTTGLFELAQSAFFTVASNATLAVGGTFTNGVGGASTTFTGSTLHLYSGTQTSLNTKSAGSDTYGRLSVGPGTYAAMWNSQATNYNVDTTGSLYSQDHAAIDGDLYIWGNYVRTSGTDYWSYATDFDGTALGGGARQVDVRIAASSSAHYENATLQILGSTAATTTVDSQSGFYTLSVATSTLSAQYYSIANTATSGFALLGSSTISSLGSGSYTLGYSGGTSLSIAAHTIAANPELQIFALSFGTSTGVVTGANATASGTPTSFWWFREHYGSFDGEAYDQDPLVDPGALRWDDSGYSIAISGRVFADDGSTVSSVCDGSTQVVRLVVDGSTSYDTSCASGTGFFSIPGVSFTGDVDLIAFLNTNGGRRAAVVSRTPITDITNFHLYENRTIVRHEDVDVVAIANMATYDRDNDTDIPFTAATSTPTLTTEPGTGLHIWNAKTFTPGGSVTLVSGGVGTEDGSLYLATSSSFIAAAGQSHAIGGSFFMDAASVFTPSTASIALTATTSGKYLAASTTLYALTFSGSGTWNLARPLVVTNTATIPAGTLAGTSTLVVNQGGFSGAGTVSMTGGTITLGAGGSFGGNANWTVNNLLVGGAAASTTKSGLGTMNILGSVTVQTGHTLNAGSVEWNYQGGGSPLVLNGTLDAQTSTTTFSAASATAIPAATYYVLNLSPASGGGPTYTPSSGSFTVSRDLFIGGGVHPVTINANANDPLIVVTRNVEIRSSASYGASNINDLIIGGSYDNNGTFTSNSGGVVFNSTDTGETVDPGNSSFHNVSFNGSGGGWTVLSSATSTGGFSLTNGASFTLTSGTSLAVGGVFTNTIGGAATTWTNTLVRLYSATNYTINTKSAGADTYATLLVDANTDIRMWDSAAGTTVVDATGSLYSQDHAGVAGELYIWGEYIRSTGADYWSYATDFDGVALGGGSRAVSVYIQPSSTTTLSGGSLEIRGATSTATTSITSMSAGTYGLRVTGGTLDAKFYRLRNLSGQGLSISGSPVITELGYGDYELAISGGSMLTVAGATINANPLKTFRSASFATSSGVVNGFNVSVTGGSVSSWRFADSYGNYDGESFDNDPGGDPGNVVWDDSAADIEVSGTVYANEGQGISTVCDGATPVVQLLVAGGSPQAVPCDSGTGAYTVSNIFYTEGDSIIVYLNTAGGRRAATVTTDPVSTITDMDLYENRVIVRHEDSDPISISEMIDYDSDQDTDIPFDAEDGTPDTLVLVPNTALYVWTNKTFTPSGNVTLQSGGSGSVYDGSLTIATSSVFIAGAGETHSVGGSLTGYQGALFTASTSAVQFTATTTGKSISLETPTFYSLSFTGSGGAWTFAGTHATATNNVTVSAGTLTFPTGAFAIGGSFDALGGSFAAASSTLRFTSTSAGNTVRFAGSNPHAVRFVGSGGGYTLLDTNATTTDTFAIEAGTVALPSGTLAVAGSFTNAGTFTHAGTLRFTATSSGASITLGGSSARNLVFDGAGSWVFTDANATSSGTTTIVNGGLTAPSGIFAIGRSFSNLGSFNANAGTLRFFGSTTALSITPGGATFSSVDIDGVLGDFTLTQSATTSNSMTLRAARTFTQTSGTSLGVLGTFTNGVQNASTTWTGTTLHLSSATNYTINTKSAGGDTYDRLSVASSTHIRAWNSSAGGYNIDPAGSLYSQDHSAVDGDLSIWGQYTRSSGADYWSYATDFDGTALGGGSRQVDVRVATSSSVTLSGGSLSITGAAGASTTVAVQTAGTYAFSITGGTFSAQHYSIANTNAAGLAFSGSPTISELSNGEFIVGINQGTGITVAAGTIDANPTKTWSAMRFATSSGVATGTNVVRTATTTNTWTFALGGGGALFGETYDSDGSDQCGSIRFPDSLCLEVSQLHYRFRADDGGEGAPNTQWYDGNWTKRKRVTVISPTTTDLTNHPVQVPITYDGDMQVDFDDIRFTDTDGTTLLDYWFEAYTNSATATAWVKVPSVPGGASTYIYMYYGNAGAATGQNPGNVFAAVDDFEDDSLSEYSGDSSLFDTDTGFNFQGSYGLAASAGNSESQTTDGIYRTGASSTVARGNKFTFYQYVDASKDDEPCTLFGVQSPGSNNQNYAVCLDQFPEEKVTIAEDVSNSDSSGTTLATSSVSYTTGWYKVEVDWYSSGRIVANVFNPSGTLVAAPSTTDTTYSTGGFGFSYWYQAGGWDSVFARTLMDNEPYVLISGEQGKDGAAWLADQDDALAGQAIDDPFRLRVGVLNSGPAIVDQNFRVQYASKTGYATCEAVPTVAYNDVPNTGSCGSSPVCMAASAQFTNQDPTSHHLTMSQTATFTPGMLVEDPSNETNDIDVDQNYFTEAEYALELTSFADDSDYCLRVTDGGLELDTYPRVPEVSINHIPTISDWRLNLNDPISLTEGTTTTVVATATVSDLNGYADIVSATSTLYRSALGAQCSADANNCYKLEFTQCPLSACSGSSCTVTCTAPVEYFAEPTDSGSSFSLQEWRSFLSIQDGNQNYATDTAPGVDLMTLWAIGLATSSIDYGTLSAGADTGTYNATTTLENTGNAAIDIDVAGSNLSGGASTIAVGNQKFSTSSFNYAACAICQFLSGTSTVFEVDLPKATATTSPSQDEIYWGIYVPLGTAGVTHAGTTTFFATGD